MLAKALLASIPSPTDHLILSHYAQTLTARQTLFERSTTGTKVYAWCREHVEDRYTATTGCKECNVGIASSVFTIRSTPLYMFMYRVR